jgi:hypothetical protein
MYYTHHFAHHETLRRACDWLAQLGFHPDRTRAGSDGTPWLAIPVGPGQYAEVALLVNAVERTDPQGWPSFWDEARLAHSAPTDSGRADDPAHATTRHALIGWHPIDATRPVDDVDLDSFREAMGH